MLDTSPSRVTVTKLGGFVGAIISNVDLRQTQDAETYAEIRRAYDAHGVIFFRDQPLTPKQFLELGRRLGQPGITNAQPHVDDLPEVTVLTKEADRTSGYGDVWHVDQSFREEPVRGTILQAVDMPPYGGDTLFLSAAAAFDALPESLKAMLRTLNAVHTRSWFTHGDKFRDARKQAKTSAFLNLDGSSKLDDVAIHPVVTRHPNTGREVLFVNPGYTARFEGWSEGESAPLLKQLFDHCQQPEFQCRFKWGVGDIAYWDNWQVWHYAVNDYQGHRREMQRMIML